MRGNGRVTAVVAAALIWTSVAASAPGSTGRISPGFVAKTDRLCAAIDASFARVLGSKFPYPKFNAEKPDRPTLMLVGQYFARALPIRGRIPGQLLALGEPASGRAAWAAIRSLAFEQNAVALDQISAALAGNAKAFVATVHRYEQLHGLIGGKGVAAGFPKTTACGDVF